jgi:hypothetical protein
MRKLKKQMKKEAEQVSEALRSLLINVRLPKFRNPFIFLKAALVSLLLFVNVSGTTSHIKDSTGASAMEIKISPEMVYVNNLRTNFQTKLVEEVDRYITEMAPTSGLEAYHVVEKCLEYETNIVFVLAQGLLESHFGTKGVAARTNSVWNVGAFDNQRPRNWYKSPNESLEPYLKLIQEDYLINITHQGDTIHKDLHHLVEDRSYVNYAGNRFASARGYENAMRKLMVRINMETSINFYQEIISLSNGEMIAYFVPREELDPASFQAMNW